MHSSALNMGLAECWSALPRGGAQPMPRFFDRSPEAGRQMGFEVGDHNHAVGGGDLPRDLDLLEVLSRNGYLPEAVTLQAVGDDDRRPGHGAAKAVLLCRLQVDGCIAAAAPVKGVGIGEKGPGAPIQDHFSNGPDQDRIDIGVVAQLAEVDLDGCEVALFYDLGESCGIK